MVYFIFFNFLPSGVWSSWDPAILRWCYRSFLNCSAHIHISTRQSQTWTTRPVSFTHLKISNTHRGAGTWVTPPTEGLRRSSIMTCWCSLAALSLLYCCALRFLVLDSVDLRYRRPGVGVQCCQVVPHHAGAVLRPHLQTLRLPEGQPLPPRAAAKSENWNTASHYKLAALTAASQLGCLIFFSQSCFWEKCPSDLENTVNPTANSTCTSVSSDWCWWRSRSFLSLSVF